MPCLSNERSDNSPCRYVNFLGLWWWLYLQGVAPIPCVITIRKRHRKIQFNSKMWILHSFEKVMTDVVCYVDPRKLVTLYQDPQFWKLVVSISTEGGAVGGEKLSPAPSTPLPQFGMGVLPKIALAKSGSKVSPANAMRSRRKGIHFFRLLTFHSHVEHQVTARLYNCFIKFQKDVVVRRPPRIS